MTMIRAGFQKDSRCRLVKTTLTQVITVNGNEIAASGRFDIATSCFFFSEVDPSLKMKAFVKYSKYIADCTSTVVATVYDVSESGNEYDDGSVLRFQVQLPGEYESDFQFIQMMEENFCAAVKENESLFDRKLIEEKNQSKSIKKDGFDENQYFDSF